MGKTRAEIQRAYRQRKREREGDSYLEKERQRVKKYYVPIDERSKKEQKARRDKVRKFVQEHRIRKRIEKAQAETTHHEIEMDDDVDENGVSSTTSTPKLVVKLPKIDSKERTRKRVSRAVAKQHRQIQQLKQKNIDLQKSYKRVSKKFECLAKREKAAIGSQEEKRVNDGQLTSAKPSLTPRKRLTKDLREVGVSPSKIPRTLKTALCLEM